MKVGSLFSGIGGFDLGLERAGYEIIWQVENNDYCRHVLKKHWPAVPCHYDIKTIDWEWVPRVDLVCGGFPCQPFSCAGKRQGKNDDRYLWPEVVRCLSTIRPTWFLGENVPGILHLGIDQVLSDLEALGYQTAVLGIPACGVDAPHIRQRLWFLAHTNSSRESDQSQHEQREIQGAMDVADAISPDGGGERRVPELVADQERRTVEAGGASLQPSHGIACAENAESSGEDVADAEIGGLERRRQQPSSHTKRSGQIKSMGSGRTNNGRWLPEPAVGRVAHGIPNRVDRLRGLGNAVVPAIVETLGKMILEVERENLHGMQRNKASE